MTFTRITSYLARAIPVLAALPLAAHHAGAGFDKAKPVTLTGALTRIEWINPHAFFHLDVKGADGNMTSWLVEAPAPGVLAHAGLTKESFRPGDEMSVGVWLAKDGAHRADVIDGETVKLAGGQTIRVPVFSRSGEAILFKRKAAKRDAVE